MIYFILILLLINVFIIDFVAIKIFKEFQKANNLTGNLNLSDLDDDFWN